MIRMFFRRRVRRNCKPRASGDDPDPDDDHEDTDIVNPARAGMIPPLSSPPCPSPSKPRASGDDPATFAMTSLPAE